jgi:hypothetical protein
MMFWCKVFVAKHDTVVAVCDEELLDKNIKTKDLTIKISKNFYGGQKVDEKTVSQLLSIATIGNLFGKNAVELAKRHGLVAEENIISINGVLHAQFVKIIE